MKTFSLKQNSWHYRLATTYGPIHDWEYEVNFCKYFWSVIAGMFSISFIILGSTVILIPLSYTVSWVAAMISTGSFIESDSIAYAYPTLIIGILVVSVVGHLYGLIKDSIEEKRVKKNYDERNYKDSFLTLAYRKFKTKTCFKVKFDK